MFMGGNRSGKTVGGAALAVCYMTGEHTLRDENGEEFHLDYIPQTPTRGRVVGVDFNLGINQIIIPEIQRWLPTKYLIDNSWDKSYSKTDRILTLNNGSTVEFMSYEQDREKFQGTSRNWTWFDEEPPSEIFKECLVRLIDTDGDWWMTMTPLIEMSWTYDTLYEPALAGEISVEVIEVETFENPYIRREAYDRLTETMSAEEKKTRSTGVYISHTGLVYGEVFSTTNNVCPDILKSTRWPVLRDNWSHFQMIDHGFNNPTAILFGAYNEDSKIIIYDEIYINKTIIPDLASKWLHRQLELGISTQYIIGDPALAQTDPEQGVTRQAQFAEHGIFIGLGNNNVDSGISYVQIMFREQQLIITTRCKETLKELRKYRWDRHLTKIRDRSNLKEKPVKKDDHAMDSLRYGVMSRPTKFAIDTQSREVVQGLHVTMPATDYDWEQAYKNELTIDEFLGSEL
jgi:phage terminase large subunit-like protein